MLSRYSYKVGTCVNFSGEDAPPKDTSRRIILIAVFCSLIIHAISLIFITFDNTKFFSNLETHYSLSVHVQSAYNKPSTVSDDSGTIQKVQNNKVANTTNKEDNIRKSPQFKSNKKFNDLKENAHNTNNLSTKKPTEDKTLSLGYFQDTPSLIIPNYADRIKNNEAVKQKEDALDTKKDYYRYKSNNGKDVYVQGTNCFQISQVKSFKVEEAMSLPSRCSWMKTESEKMAENIKEAMNKLREKHSVTTQK